MGWPCVQSARGPHQDAEGAGGLAEWVVAPSRWGGTAQGCRGCRGWHWVVLALTPAQRPLSCVLEPRGPDCAVPHLEFLTPQGMASQAPPSRLLGYHLLVGTPSSLLLTHLLRCELGPREWMEHRGECTHPVWQVGTQQDLAPAGPWQICVVTTVTVGVGCWQVLGRGHRTSRKGGSPMGGILAEALRGYLGDEQVWR